MVTLAVRWFPVTGIENDRCCAVCGRPVPMLVRGDCVAGLVSGEELVAVVGEECLTESARSELSRLRRQVEDTWRSFLSAPRPAR